MINTANVGSTRDLISQNKMCIKAKDCKADTTYIFFFHSASEEGFHCKPKYRAILFKIIQSIIPFYLILVISAVGINVPSIFCKMRNPGNDVS